MEDTLGKRIAANRRRLGITQERLAEQLGVTAQAVSKWENDQSCPDISILPKLAKIFGVSTDSLLGIAPEAKEDRVQEAAAVTDAAKSGTNRGIHMNSDVGPWELNWHGGRKNTLALAIGVLLFGTLLLLREVLKWEAGVWDILWPTALLVFGCVGIWPKFSLFRLLCGLFGGYSLLLNIGLLPFALGWKILLPALVLCLGIELLLNGLHSPKKHGFRIRHNGTKAENASFEYRADGESFSCDAAFCETEYPVVLPLLRRGEIDLSFGEVTVDLSGCEQAASDCYIKADCSFGELSLLVPKRFRVVPSTDTTFATLSISGEPDEAPIGTIQLNGDASFGEISVRYI